MDAVECAEPRRSEVRCAYCHGSADPMVEACSACGTLLHADCRAQAGSCPTLGCEQHVRIIHKEAAKPSQTAAPAPPRTRSRVAMAVVCVAAALWLGEALWSRANPGALVGYYYYNPQYQDWTYWQMRGGPRGGPPAPTDPWGGDWLSRDPSSLLIADIYTPGPNGVDEKGRGDDVFVPAFSNAQWIGTWALIQGKRLMTVVALFALWLLAWWRVDARADD